MARCPLDRVTMGRLLGIVGLTVALLVARPAAAGPDGVIRVIDGDTIDVGATRVRLFGIDAPERDQTCQRSDGADWACGAWVTGEVRRAFEGRRAACEDLGTDRYDRVIARCRVAGRDMADTIVRAGLAQAYRRYSRDYVDAEKAALVAGRGIFAAQMIAPAEHRAARTRAEPVPEGCPIKGNISNSGRIYHLPGQADYARTRVTESKGERWFCSEAEAQAAGWRKARR